MLIEDQRFLHEDLERLEQAISDRVSEDPQGIRERLQRDHEISGLLDRISQQSSRLIDIYRDEDGSLAREIQAAGTGDAFDEFYRQLKDIKEHHRKYPNEPVEDLTLTYKRKAPGDGQTNAVDVDKMFSGEEAYGRYFDLTQMHEQYLNLPGIQNVRRFTYLQYLDFFDVFTPPQCAVKRQDKLKDEYFQYVGDLASYLESFMTKTKPLESLDKFFAEIDKEFEEAWTADKVPGWSSSQATTAGPATEEAQGTGEGIWCADCEKEFKNENVYRNHLTGKKHIRAAEARSGQISTNDGGDRAAHHLSLRLKERAVAEREFRVRKLVAAMQTVRSDTKVNVERRQGMTERERQQELEALFAESAEGAAQNGENGDEDDGDDKIYNPLKLPLAWDGKPIPFWLYKLHGLGVEYPCEICGNFVYMGRRAFDKHFNEARHIYGLKCLGISNATLFREITRIDEAQSLWAKIQQEKKKERANADNIVQMEDSMGNVMPERVYLDLSKQGLI